MIDLSVCIAGMKMQNPIMPASGCFGYGEVYECVDGFDNNKLGAIVTKGTSLLARDGNPQPRIAEVPMGMINFIGLQNPGVEVVVREKLPYLFRFKVPVIVNVSGSSVDDYPRVVEILETSDVVTAYELNISCPNVKEGGVAFGQDPDMAAKVVRAVRPITKKPLIPKLTPNVASVVPIAKAVINEGADAISLINTLKARAKLWTSDNRGKYVEGGLSGPCIRTVAVRMVSDLAKANLGVPIIGLGGIESLYDVVEFLESGATAVQVGTANFRNPLIMMVLIKQLEEYIAEVGCQNLQEWKQKGFPMPKEKRELPDVE